MSMSLKNRNENPCKTIDTARNVCRDYHKRINDLEDKKFDLEYFVKKKDFEVSIINFFFVLTCNAKCTYIRGSLNISKKKAIYLKAAANYEKNAARQPILIK
jgi:Troponin